MKKHTVELKVLEKQMLLIMAYALRKGRELDVSEATMNFDKAIMKRDLAGARIWIDKAWRSLERQQRRCKRTRPQVQAKQDNDEKR